MAKHKELVLDDDDDWSDDGGEEIEIPEDDECTDFLDKDFAVGYTKHRNTWDLD